MPHYYNNETFIKNCNNYNTNTLYCHQEFNGCEYENGFYSKNGADPKSINQKEVVCGHIHRTQSFDKIWYIGSPRWRSVSDANEEKGVWIIEHDKESGIIVNKTFIDTSDVCRPILSFKDYPNIPAIIPDKNATIIIDIHGPEDYVEKRNKELSGKGYRLRNFVDKKEQIKIKESEGLNVAFKKYLDSYIPKNGTDKNRLLAISMEKIEWMKRQ
ncbi:MAG: hypothetical protein KGO96_07460 [Elusimicrobia bacterium]|nr:hypothetical protein [Elusimicrobiota bacterium]